MKTLIKLQPVIICSLLMAAHLGRANMFVLQIISIFIPILLIWKTKISVRTIQLLLFLYGVEWIRSLISYVNIRIESGQDWIRLAIILGLVALLNFVSIFVFRSKHLKEVYRLG